MDIFSSRPVYRVERSTALPDESDKRVLVNILIVDATDGYRTPSAYQMRNDSAFDEPEFSQLPSSELKIYKEELVNIGFVDIIKRKSRLAVLQTGALVIYRHLIVFGSSHSRTREEYFSALLSLLDAMRVKSKLENPVQLLALPFLSSEASTPTAARGREAPPAVEKVFEEQMTKVSLGSLFARSGAESLSLYELQL